MTPSTPAERQVARLARVHDDDLTGRAASDAARHLLAALIAEHAAAPGASSPAASAAPSRSPWSRFPWSQGPWSAGPWSAGRRFALAAAATGAMTVALVAGPGLLPDGTGTATSYANSAIEINREGEFFVARIKDPLARHALYVDAFREVGKNIQIDLVPVPDDLVGVLLRGEGNGSTRTTSELDCSRGPSACTVVMRVSVQGDGTMRYTIGRAARPGEAMQNVPDDAGSSRPGTPGKSPIPGRNSVSPPARHTPPQTTGGNVTGGSGD